MKAAIFSTTFENLKLLLQLPEDINITDMWKEPMINGCVHIRIESENLKDIKSGELITRIAPDITAVDGVYYWNGLYEK